jgi:hypothetical protein
MLNKIPPLFERGARGDFRKVAIFSNLHIVIKNPPYPPLRKGGIGK